MENTKLEYVKPAISEIASLQELTLDINKDLAPVSDGYTFLHMPINVVS